jgi:hypothetical protein
VENSAPDDEATRSSADAGVRIGSAYSECDSLFIATYPGTACCVSGSLQARPGDTIEYHYQMNRDYPEIQWEIRSGDITIEKGQDTHTVTVKFGPSFTKGEIVGLGIATVPVAYSDTTTTIACSERIRIANPDGD